MFESLKVPEVVVQHIRIEMVVAHSVKLIEQQAQVLEEVLLAKTTALASLNLMVMTGNC